MSHINFGGKSGAILDRCGNHGIRIEGSKLRRLTKWWRAGGKRIYQKHENHQTKLHYGSIISLDEPRSESLGFPIPDIDPAILIDLIVSVASSVLEN